MFAVATALGVLHRRMPSNCGLTASHNLVEVMSAWSWNWLLAPDYVSVWAIWVGSVRIRVWLIRLRRHVRRKGVDRVAVAASHAHADASKNERNEGEKTQQSEGNLPRSLVGEATVQKAVAQIAIIYWPWLWLCQK